MSNESHIGYWVTALVVVVLVAAYAYARDIHAKYYQYRNSADAVLSAQQTLEERLNTEQLLEQKLERLARDRVEQEAVGRSRKNLVKPGEVVYRFEAAEPEADAVQQGDLR